jgi:RNA polymerase sigma-70 factor (ECF subfamily)
LNKSVTEENLIRECQQRKARAQRMVYETYSATMFSICLRYLKDPASAEDVLVTSFMKVFEKIDQFKSEGSFEGWIRRIVINESLGYIRKNKNMSLEVDLEKAASQPDYDMLESQLQADELMAIIQELPVGYRTVFNLYAVEGYSHAEIAEMLQISESTSKSQLSRARALLQKQLLKLEDRMNQIEKNYEGPKIG